MSDADTSLAVAAWLRAYASSLRGAAVESLPIAASAYVAQLRRDAPSPTRGNPYSTGLTQARYTFRIVGGQALITNHRGSAEGRRGQGYGEEVADLIDRGSTSKGPGTARAFRRRRIGDAYHLAAWRHVRPELRKQYLSAVLNSARGRLHG